MEKLYTVTELMEILQVSNKTLYRYFSSGKLKGSKIGKSWRVSQTQLDEFLNKETN